MLCGITIANQKRKSDMKRTKRQDGKNTCFTDCIAFVLGLDPKDTPFFIGYSPETWIKRTQDFFKERGYEIKPEKFSYQKLDDNVLYLVQGLSHSSKISATAPYNKRRLGINHCVVYLGRKRLYDPSKKGRYLKGYPLYLWKVTPDMKVAPLPTSPVEK